MPAGVHRSVDIQAVFPARQKVVRSVSGSRVHRTGSLFERHIIGKHTDGIALVQRMRESNAFELLALHARDWHTERTGNRLADRLRELLRNDHRAAVDVVRRVVELGMKRDRHVRRNSPWRRRPDEDRYVPSRERRHARGEFSGAFRIDREFHVNRRRRVVGVLDFRFRERGAAMDAPVDRLLAFINKFPADELPEGARDVRLISRIHGQVVVVPIAEHHQPLELGGHHVDVPAGVFAAGAADVRDRHAALLRAKLAIDFELDRQTVAVVPRGVRHVEAGHRS